MILQNRRTGFVTWRSLVTILSISTGLVILWLAVQSMMASGNGDEAFVHYTVQRTSLPIVITERGNLESQVETEIVCEVENVAVDRSGNAGTQIIFIVPNGSAVEKGDLLVELDSATIRDRLDEQTLAYQKATSAKTQAIAKYDNQLIQNKTAEEEAKLQVKLAELELEMYMDPENGTYQLAKEDIERQIDDAKNQTLEARAALELARVDRSGIEELFKLGYRGKSDLDQSMLSYLQAEDRLASSINQMETYKANLEKLNEYEFRMQKLQLEGAVETAKRALTQVRNDNESLAEQALAAKQEAIKTEEKEKERLDRLTAQLENCKIYAPHGGMVVYHRGRRGNTEIMEGATVRERQELLSLPNLSKMQVKTQVHEAVLDQIRPGQPVTVRVDAFPDQTYAAVVETVGVVPTSDRGWFSSSSVKTYETVVKLTDDVVGLKPGMTAVANIHVDKIENVLAIPVQAVVQRDRQTWCYVTTDAGVERRDITIGRSNDKFVHVREGLQEGERVVLNPMDVVDQQGIDEPSESQGGDEKEISPDIGTPELPEDVRQKAAAAAKQISSEQGPRRGRGDMRRDGAGRAGPGRGPGQNRAGGPGPGGGPRGDQPRAGRPGGSAPNQGGPGSRASGGQPSRSDDTQQNSNDDSAKAIQADSKSASESDA